MPLCPRSGNVLVIHNIKKEDRGMYYCVATNGVTEGTRRNVAVEVEFPPVISVPRPDVRQVGTYSLRRGVHQLWQVCMHPLRQIADRCGTNMCAYGKPVCSMRRTLIMPRSDLPRLPLAVSRAVTSVVSLVLLGC